MWVFEIGALLHAASDGHRFSHFPLTLFSLFPPPGANCRDLYG